MTDSENESRTAPERKSVLRNALAAIDSLQAKVSEMERAKSEPIAIVGLSCRLPGAANAIEFWKLLQEGKNAVKEVPADRWPKDAFYDPDPTAPGKIHAPYGGFLDNLGQFDAAFFGISGREAESLDPQQRLLLEVAWEALENAAIAPDRLRGSNTGVFVGITTSDYARLAAAGDPADLDVYSATGGALNAAAGRLSFVLGLNGPSIAIDTACSSSLVALHLACQSLRSRECSAALAGGVNVLLTPEPFVCFAKWGMMAADGRCKTFDEAADGFVRAEGCGMVVLKRLHDAQAAGDRILALIAGSAVNQDGASSGLTVPNGLAQQAVIRTALESAHLQAPDLDYVEAHGTGTTLGDPIELEAIASVLARDRPFGLPLRVGSVKTNIGHAESASGIAGLIKIVLAMEHGQIPPHINFRKISSRISLGKAAIEIPVRCLPWPRTSRPRIAGISSFGFSGTNAHAILQEAPLPSLVAAPRIRPVNLLVLSAKSEAALHSLAEQYANILKGAPSSAWPDLCHTAAIGRSALPHRLAVVVDGFDVPAALNRLEKAAAGTTFHGVTSGRAKPGTKIAFVFPGDKGWSHGRGRSFYENEPVFRDAFDRCAAVFDRKNDIPLVELAGYREMDTSGRILTGETVHALPALFAFEYSLALLWRSWGIEPSGVAGHGSGEFVAAAIAGVLTVENAMELIILRSRLLRDVPSDVSRAEIIAGSDRVRQAITPKFPSVVIAAVNGPASTVVSGNADEISAWLAQFTTEGVGVHPLPGRHASDSPLMASIHSKLGELAASIPHLAPTIDIVLNATGNILDGSSPMDPSYWGHNSREPLLGAQTIHALKSRGINLFLEIGPDANLTERAGDCGEWWLPSLRASGDWSDILSSLGAIFVSGIQPDWHAHDRPYSRRVVDAPLYPFQRKFFWLGQARKPGCNHPSAIAANGIEPTGHPFLGARRLSPLSASEFTCNLDPGHWPVLGEHRVAGVTLFPAAGFIELGCAAARAVFGGQSARIEQGWLRTALVLDPDVRRDVHLIVTPRDQSSAKFEIFSRIPREGSEEGWTSHAGGSLIANSGGIEKSESMAQVQARCGTPIDVDSYQRGMEAVGLEYGPSFRALKSANRGQRESFGTLQLPPTDTIYRHLYVHPGILDASFHLIGIALGENVKDQFYLPVGYESAETVKPAGVLAHAHVRLREPNVSRVIADVTVWDADGNLTVDVRGLQARAISREQFRELLGNEPKFGLLTIAWRPAPAAQTATAGGSVWNVIGGEESLAVSVDQKLRARGTLTRRLTGTEAARLAESPDSAYAPGGVIDLRALYVPENTTTPSDEFAAGPGMEILALLRSIAENQPTAGYRIVVPTLRAQAVMPDELVNPLGSILWGLAAGATAEIPGLDLRMIDLANPADDATAIVETALRTDEESRLAVRHGKTFAARLASIDSPPAVGLAVPKGSYELFMRERGSLTGLDVKRKPRADPGEGCVEIQVLASGLNFRDVLNLLDMYPGPAGPLGNECCGRIVALGAGVEGHAIGDLVTCIADATFSSHVVAQAGLVFPVPAELSVAQAAVFPIAQLTAYLALFRVGKIKAGDRVLVHAGAGGVGLAAVHLALAADAVVFATAGSEEKRRYLRTIGVTEVFDSRHPLAANVVRAATGGRGIDLLLNSLTGEFIDEGLRTLAPGGRFLEIGLRELRTADQVRALRRDVTYHPLLLGDHCRKDPAFVRAMYDELVALLRAKKIPAPRTKTFPVAQADAAFRHMAKARHVGRIAIMHPAAGQSRVRGDGTYLVTGGLGAIGLHVAQWLVDEGAKQLILLGRSDPSDLAATTLANLRARGVEIESIQGDVSKATDCTFFTDARRPPIRGILHAAGIVDDAILSRVDTARLRRGLKPKADGAFNLLEALASAGVDPDFVVFFSSGSSILGSPGQAAYASANAYLDGLAHRLRAQGTTAVSINWGAWQDGGMAARLDGKTTRDWTRRGIGTLSTATARAMLADAVASGLAQVAALPISWPKFFQSLPAGRSVAFLSELRTASPAAEETRLPPEVSGGKDQLLELSPSERVNALTLRLIPIAAAVLGLGDPRDLDLETGLTEQGMDSLTAVELRNRLQSELGLLCPVNRLLASPTLGELSQELSLQFAAPDAVSNPGAVTVTEGEI